MIKICKILSEYALETGLESDPKYRVQDSADDPYLTLSRILSLLKNDDYLDNIIR